MNEQKLKEVLKELAEVIEYDDSYKKKIDEIFEEKPTKKIMKKNNELKEITEKEIQNFDKPVLIDIACMKLEELKNNGIYLATEEKGEAKTTHFDKFRAVEQAIDKLSEHEAYEEFMEIYNEYKKHKILLEFDIWFRTKKQEWEKKLRS